MCFEHKQAIVSLVELHQHTRGQGGGGSLLAGVVVESGQDSEEDLGGGVMGLWNKADGS
jgi:hypothetical protein